MHPSRLATLLLGFTLFSTFCASFAVAQEASRPAPANPSRLVVERVVAASRPEVFQAWTTKAGLESFFAAEARIALRPGGPFELALAPEAPVGERGSEGCKVLSWIRNEMFSFSWNAPSEFGVLRGVHGFVVLRLHDAEDGATRVELIHDGFAPAAAGGDRVRAYFEKAWPVVLGNLATWLESGKPVVERPEATRPLARASKTFAIFLSPTSREAVLNPDAEQLEAFGGHVAHMQKMWANGRVLLIGPCPADPVLPSDPKQALKDMPLFPGLVLIRAVDLAEAKLLMESDPAVRAGIFRTCLFPLEASFVGQ